MSNKYKDAPKAQPQSKPAGDPPVGQNEALVAKGHSQDADRHEKTRHPRSDK